MKKIFSKLINRFMGNLTGNMMGSLMNRFGAKLTAKTNLNPLILLTILFMCGLPGPKLFAYIPSSKLILEKVAENNIAGPVYYEQEVVLNGNSVSASLKETWYVDSDNVMVVLVQGEKELKDKIQFGIQYNGKRRLGTINFIKNNENVTSSFFEPIFFIKSPQKLTSYIVGTGVVGSGIQESTNFQKQKDVFVHTPEPFVRLGRTGGVVAYLISGSTGVATGLPGLWIEQDQFLLRKIRNAKMTEMNIEKWGHYTRGWVLPKERTILWNDKTAQIKMLEVKVPQSKLKSLITKSHDIIAPEFESSKEKELIEEFYLRLR